VPAVALNAAWGLVPASWKRIGTRHAEKARWVVYGLVGGGAAATVGPYLVLVLLACGATEILVRRAGRPMSPGSLRAFIPAVVLHGAAVGGLGALAWVAFKVGALSYGGGFVIVPLGRLRQGPGRCAESPARTRTYGKRKGGVWPSMRW
jgi:chromate transporter